MQFGKRNILNKSIYKIHVAKTMKQIHGLTLHIENEKNTLYKRTTRANQ
jgi:hypothetical protein